ncbi:Histone RNA hairpin-binding protein [Nymphon striatum]|nr:Histone RNA hairpin-binding protein [Nymphon striatum]
MSLSVDKRSNDRSGSKMYCNDNSLSYGSNSMSRSSNSNNESTFSGKVRKSRGTRSENPSSILQRPTRNNNQNKNQSQKRRLDFGDDNHVATKSDRTFNKKGSYDNEKKPNNGTANAKYSSPASRKFQVERNSDILDRRQKQIDYGKNTICYQRYNDEIKKSDRTKNHPSTPNKNIVYSRRSWDKQIKIWRQQLHIWDPPVGDNDSELDLSLISDVTIDLDSPIKSNTRSDCEVNEDEHIPSDKSQTNFDGQKEDFKRQRTSSKFILEDSQYDELDFDYSDSDTSST